MPPAPGLAYRPEIDGLRALAVGGGASLGLAALSYFTVEAHFRRQRAAQRAMATAGPA